MVHVYLHKLINSEVKYIHDLYRAMVELTSVACCIPTVYITPLI